MLLGLMLYLIAIRCYVGGMVHDNNLKLLLHLTFVGVNSFAAVCFVYVKNKIINPIEWT